MRKRILILMTFILMLVSVLVVMFLNEKQKNKIKLERERLEYIQNIKDSYSKYVITNKETNLYDSNKNIIGKINKNVKIALKDKTIKDEKDDYFELELFDNHYLYFKDVDKTYNLGEKDDYYKKYIVFNENCVTSNKTVFYDNNFNYIYEVSTGINVPIYIKEDKYYGVEFNNELLYLKKDDVKVVKTKNTDEINAKSVPVLLYHFFHNHNKFENWVTVISMRIDKFEKQLEYLIDNNFMTLKMKDFELYIDGKIQIKEASVLITIDDGNYSVFDLAYPVIEKYGVNVTLFVVTSYDESIINKQTENVEIHSHTHNMHITGMCSGDQGGLFKCIDYDKGLADLIKSRKLLNGSKYLAYPFGEYTDLSIKLLKDAGYTMAFTTERRNAVVGEDKYLLPRIYIYNEYSLDTFKKIVN